MLDLIKKLIDFIIHIDKHLAEIIASYGLWTYGFLFLIIFAETGLVVTPFLPGDSLLFATGAFCAKPETGLNVHVMALLLFVAAFIGDTLNYWIGAKIGPAVFKREDSIFLRKKHLERAHPSPVCSHRAHLRAFRCWSGADELFAFHRLQCDRRLHLDLLFHLRGLLVRQPTFRAEKLQTCDSRDHLPIHRAHYCRILARLA